MPSGLRIYCMGAWTLRAQLLHCALSSEIYDTGHGKYLVINLNALPSRLIEDLGLLLQLQHGVGQSQGQK